MLFATLGDWGTHYDRLSAGHGGDDGRHGPVVLGRMSFPQVLFWVVLWTTLLGGLITWVTARFSARAD